MKVFRLPGPSYSYKPGAGAARPLDQSQAVQAGRLSLAEEARRRSRPSASGENRRQADQADPQASRLHRRARRGSVQARPLPVLAGRSGTSFEGPAGALTALHLARIWRTRATGEWSSLSSKGKEEREPAPRPVNIEMRARSRSRPVPPGSNGTSHFLSTPFGLLEYSMFSCKNVGSG